VVLFTDGRIKGIKVKNDPHSISELAIISEDPFWNWNDTLVFNLPPHKFERIIVDYVNLSNKNLENVSFLNLTTKAHPRCVDWPEFLSLFSTNLIQHAYIDFQGWNLKEEDAMETFAQFLRNKTVLKKCVVTFLNDQRQHGILGNIACLLQPTKYYYLIGSKMLPRELIKLLLVKYLNPF
jgi:hypothetical protein